MKNPQPSQFAAGLDHPEGLAFDRDGNLWAGGEAGQIYRISPDGNKVEMLAGTGGFNLGLAFSPEGWLLICDCGGHKLWRFEPKTKKLSVFATHSAGHPLGHMNFPVFDRAGRLYVSESGTWGKRDGVVHRFTPDGAGERWLEKIHFANGLALNAAESALYVVQSTRENVLCVPIRTDGEAGRAKVFVEGVAHVPDGLAFDADGWLYVSCFGDSRIWRVSPNGRKSLLVEDPSSVVINRATNVAFGGPGRRTLYIANLGGWHIARVRLTVSGQPLAGG
ncbi:MAG: SMP-30/gluconolactonase/LRE family protein [Verrucomicrobia bacterium]|jgi:gluconolactonase|nr:SMP-30/gluconolactonase/LRE family protein [Verrucomicrobiota bacterium]